MSWQRTEASAGEQRTSAAIAPVQYARGFDPDHYLHNNKGKLEHP